MCSNQFERIYELRDAMENPDAEDSCLSNLDTILQEQSANHIWSIIERDLQVLDIDAWSFLRREALQQVNRWDVKSNRNGCPRGREALLNILYQAKAYNFLKNKGCSSIRFIPRAIKNGIKTPDLEGTTEINKYLCEVKTINCSEEEVSRRRNEQKYLHKGYKLENAFFEKLGKTINVAKKQLSSYDTMNQSSHIVYIVTNFDEFWGDHKEANANQLEKYLSNNPCSDVELVFHFLLTAFNRSITLKFATVINDQ